MKTADDAPYGAEAAADRHGAAEPFMVSRKEVAAAKFRVAADRRLGRETPDWIVRVSQAKRAS